MTAFAADGQGHESARFDMRQGHVDGQEHHVHLPPQQVGDGGGGAPVWNVSDENLGRVFEQLHRHVVRGTDTR